MLLHLRRVNKNHLTSDNMIIHYTSQQDVIRETNLFSNGNWKITPDQITSYQYCWRGGRYSTLRPWNPALRCANLIKMILPLPDRAFQRHTHLTTRSVTSPSSLSMRSSLLWPDLRMIFIVILCCRWKERYEWVVSDIWYLVCCRRVFDNQPHGANLLLNAVIVIQTRLATSLITQTGIPGIVV